jgi:hypothetical protein
MVSAMGIRRERRRRQRIRWVCTTVVGVLAVSGVVFVATRPNGSHPTAATATTAPLSTAPTTTSIPISTTTITLDPGQLPQTPDRPAESSIVLGGHVQMLWDAIVADDPGRAMPFFFPLGAYIQVKGISDPEHDWRTRLVVNFDQDVHTWHAQLGPAAESAQFAGITIPSDQARWILPGVEYNKGSYWRVYGSTLHYQLDGGVSSFTIASLISWRGEWYVIHLGIWDRPGTLVTPSAGVGTFGPAGGC